MDEKELEKFTEFCNQASDKLDLLLDMEPSRIEMIKGKRDFIKQIIILSAGIIAFAIPILDKGGIITHHCVYNIALIGFVVAIIVGLAYFYRLNKEEQNTYQNFMTFTTGIDLNRDIKSVLENAISGLNDIKGKLPNPIKFHKYENLMQLFLLILFVISLILLIISLL